MRHLGEMGGGGGADLAAGRIGADQVREGRLDRGVAADQRVIFGVRNLGRVMRMVEAVVVRDLRGECLQFGGGIERRLRQVGHGCRLGERTAVGQAGSGIARIEGDRCLIRRMNFHHR
ncbi:hypothetical protein WR25_08011 [Diploscapter pachys]|uniref:Uncharacterized protein n=1 Tax=Diploscapter pachys TaxID=2018661 RepID=A0A2A2JX61_9BILA|nr:hypothetical protein WR25_08011 [Diploscapter pachys]